MESKQEILILGAGVSGLSCGVLLLKKGYPVTIWAKDLPPNTTSNKAAAVWYPYLCFPREKAITWARSTFEYLQKEMVGNSKSGCILRPFTQLFDQMQPEPWWKEAFPGEISRSSKENLPAGYIDGYCIETIVIDTSIYMDFLVDSFKSLGGNIVQKVVKNISEATQSYNIVINCTGLGSRELFNDEKVYPVRGQMVKIKTTQFNEVVVDSSGPNDLSLVVPRIHDIMLGGTSEENNWNTEINPADTKEILRKVSLIAPTLKNVEVIEQSVGLRPAREAIRLEVQAEGTKTIVHNYGHGGAGFTLSWGCAHDVVGLVEKL